MNPSRRVLVGALALAGTLLVAALVALLSAPLWIDAGAVKREIAALVQRATGDVVEIDRLQLHLFPPVSVEVARPRYAVAGVADLAAESVTVGLDFWALVTGKVQPRSIHLAGVKVAIRMPAAKEDEKPASLAAIERQLREVLSQITRAAPGLDASAEGATITLHLPGRPPLVFSNVDAELRTAGGKVDARLSGVSVFWERASVAFWLAGDPVQGAGRLEFVGLDAGRLQDFLGGDASLPRAEAELIGRIDWQMRGLADVKADAVISTPGLVLHRNGATQELRGLTAAGGLEVKGETMKLVLHRLYAQAPNLLLDGALARDERGHHELALNASGVDLVALQAAVRTLAADIPWIAKPPGTLRAGTVTALHLDSSADTLPGLFDLPVLRGEATLEGVALDIAKPALSFSGAGGRIALDHGELQVRNATATLGKSVLRNGQVDMRLADESAEDLRVDALIDLDLGETIALARRLIRNKDVDAQLDAVQKLEGKALAQVSLWGNPKSLQAAVEMSQLAVFVQHRYVPLPIRLDGGQFTYARGALSIRDAAGEFGGSGFDDLDATLSLAPPYRFEVSQRKASLSLEELHAAARNIPALKSSLAEIRSLTGKATLSDVTAEGSLQAPEETRFRAAIAPHDVKILSQRVDSEILLDGGGIDISDSVIDAKGVSVNAMDSALRVSARTENYRAGIRAIEAAVEGDLGAATLAKIYQLGSVAPAMQLRAPLHFAESKIAWKDSGDFSFKGKGRAAGTIDLEIAARKAGNKLHLDRLALKDASSDATFSGEYSGENLNAAFKGRLTGATLAGLLVQPPVSMEKIEGEFQAGLHVEKPWITRVQGRLEGTAITLSVDDAFPVKVEHAIVTASGKKVSVEQAVLTVGDSRVEISGDFHRDHDKIALDANLRADRFVLSKAMMGSEQKDAGSEQAFKLSDLPVTGRIGLDIRILETEQVTLAPVVAEVAVAGDVLDLRITEAALCGLTMSGTMKGRLDDLQLAGGLSARNADLQKSISCLTSERIVGSGRLDLDATFTAQGPLASLAERLDGEFTATARDGHIEKFDALNRVFAFLNITETVRGKKLEGAGKGLPYRTARLSGTLAGTTVRIREADLDGPTVHIVAAGHINYGSGNLGVDVLVAPLQTANAIVDKLPVIKRIFGGTVLALPVQVLGTVNTPIVVPLGPGAIASRMTSIIANTLKLPIDAIEVFTPAAPAGVK